MSVTNSHEFGGSYPPLTVAKVATIVATIVAATVTNTGTTIAMVAVTTATLKEVIIQILLRQRWMWRRWILDLKWVLQKPMREHHLATSGKLMRSPMTLRMAQRWNVMLSRNQPLPDLTKLTTTSD